MTLPTSLVLVVTINLADLNTARPAKQSLKALVTFTVYFNTWA